ncbi:helicase-exonuclease AddAB subunit AddA [Dellaglioa carnosa]|uniref:ATP-dependent helicase/nuclease subunit A n=2 Tax=Dellaglioa carnosa TaxID=2995136 RepID=A0ABT4JN40_9LACO|nr:helicase-exonuclease AddAB subunit AddA [Dellaglioa carnosa]MCZ2491629.1 helicase-exonuclease AddAB subunit AddA [Dellaglioa carnosa]MCZ2494706.1 helicase-exonuclease AddAB subunit AddA [Dellaglioa carnosa]MDK1731635.1 helicase-exonuclease AddAB subunit AddA [Dellaglioa carnosa]
MMSKFTFTPSQQRAIDESGTDILVSASAGSGKTRVLVERVIKKILAKTNIDDLLVVTFTEAAAKEMRQRIQVALQKAINETDNRVDKQHLVDQLMRLPVANISTFDAFCLQLIKRYYYVIDLDPVFRMLTDVTEAALLRESVWEDLRESLYATDDAVFERLTQNFSNDRNDDGLSELVFSLFTFASSKPNPAEWLASLAATYDVGDDLVGSSYYQTTIKPLIQADLTQIQADLKTTLDLSVHFSLTKHQVVTEEESKLLVAIVQSVDDDAAWNQIHDNIRGYKLKRAPSVPAKNLEADQAAAKDQIKDLKDGIKKRLTNLTERFFNLNETETLEIMAESKKLIEKLVDVIGLFSDAFTKEKRQRHMLDFNDLEHLALDILTRDSETSVQTRTALQAKYNEVLVDEYQDTNQLQEAILTRITTKNPGNMFMVGDVKQSIYGFRLADPGLFLSKDKAYKENDSQGNRIILAENFRSVENVTAFTNLIFTQIMDNRVGQMAYDTDAKLVFGATYYPDVEQNAEVLIYESDEPETFENPDEPMEATNEQFEIDGKSEGQVALIGQRIQELIATKTEIFDREASEKRPVAYRDIALLVPTRKNNLVIIDMFKKMGIPVVVNDAESYFQTTEIRIMMSLLRIIDNPYQDIPLVSVLRSPIVGLDENELAYLRIGNRTDDYYQAVLTFYQNFDTFKESGFAKNLYQKIDRFLTQLSGFREIAHENQIATLIWQIYQETGFLDYVGGMPAGSQRQANLHALYNRAHAYENSSFKGLFQFVRFIEKMQERDKDLAEAPVQNVENAVSVMTIHGSKGLEFPMVFLVDATHQFNQMGMRMPYLIDDKAGIGITYLNPENRTAVDALQKSIVKSAVIEKSEAEEMRLLYVALTRAEQRLFIVGAYANRETAIKRWQKAFQSQQLVLNAPARSGIKNFMDWIGMALVRHPQFDKSLLLDPPVVPQLFDEKAIKTQFSVSFYQKKDLQQLSVAEEEVTQMDWLEATTDGMPETFGTIDVDQIDKVLNFQYPFDNLTKTTAYQAVSEVKRLFDDPTNREMNQLSIAGQGNRYVTSELAVPKFMQGVTAPTGIDIGSATHLVLQELDLTTEVTLVGIQTEIKRLVSAKVLTQEVAVLINEQHISNFFQSDLGKEVVLAGNTVQREAPFSMLLPASELFQNVESPDEKVLIHGIIDGYFIKDNELILFDYKTDKVSKDNTIEEIEKLTTRYRGQLNLYGEALANMTGLKVAHKYLYLLAANRVVEV